MFGDKIDSRDKLAMELCEALDMCAENSYPVIDLTGQTVSIVFDSAYVGPEVNEGLHGHEVVYIDPIDSHEGFRIMENFALSRPDGQARRLAYALSMKHPFKRFRMALADIGVTDEWYAYKAEEYLGIAKERLEWNSVDFVDGRIVCGDRKKVCTYLCECVDD